MGKLYRPSKGLSVGLVWFLLYLLGFFILGYGLLFCMVLAAIGGIATGIVAEWWVSKDDPIAKPVAPKPADTMPSFPMSSSSALRRNTTQTQLRRHASRIETNTTGLSRFKIPFQKSRK